MSGIVNRVALDPSRVENARRRASLALQTASYHDGQAEAERAKARQLAKTWGFDLPEVGGHGSGFCRQRD